MNAIDVLARQPLGEAIAWALLQFVWQGGLIAALTAAALASLRRSAADVRYVVAVIGLALMLTMPVVTVVQSLRGPSPVADAVAFSRVLPRDEAVLVEGARATPRPGAISVGEQAASSVPPHGGTPRWPHVERWLPLLLLAWSVGVSVLTLRLVAGWLWVQRLTREGHPAAHLWTERTRRLCRRLHVNRAVRVLESSLVDVPTVVGWIKPVVLLPASALAALSPQQLEAILAHEIAHVRRHDYLVNLLQTLVETLLFYHPAVWWLSSRIRAERENCCDDVAVSLCGDPCAYARALADLEEQRGAGARLALAATDGSLLHRVRRLLGAPTSHAGRGPGWLAGTTAILVMAGIAAGALRHGVIRAQQPSLTPPMSAPAEPRASTPLAAALDDEARARHKGAARPAPTVTPASVAPVSALAGRSGGAAPNDGAQESVGNFTWSRNGETLQVQYRGAIEFSVDDADVVGLSPRGYLKVRDGRWLGARAVEIRADSAGKLDRRYWVGTSERPFEPEGRKWLAEVLPRFVRQSGLGAEARVARFLRQGGTAGVLAEIGRIEGSWAKRIYFRELLRHTTPDGQVARQILQQAGRELDSDFELASLLVEGADKLLVDERSRHAFFESARSLESDFEMRRVYAAALERGPVSAAALAVMLEASRSLESDFELASLLVQVVRLQPLEAAARGPFFRAVRSIDSAFERARVLQALARRPDLSGDTVMGILESVQDLESSHETSQVLLAVAGTHQISGRARDAYIDAAGRLDEFEQGRVFTALARNERRK